MKTTKVQRNVWHANLGRHAMDLADIRDLLDDADRCEELEWERDSARGEARDNDASYCIMRDALETTRAEVSRLTAENRAMARVVEAVPQLKCPRCGWEISAPPLRLHKCDSCAPIKSALAALAAHPETKEKP